MNLTGSQTIGAIDISSVAGASNGSWAWIGSGTLGVTNDLTSSLTGNGSLSFRAGMSVAVGGDVNIDSGVLDFGFRTGNPLKSVTVAGTTTVNSGATLTFSASTAQLHTLMANGVVNIWDKGTSETPSTQGITVTSLQGSGTVETTADNSTSNPAGVLTIGDTAGSGTFSGVILDHPIAGTPSSTITLAVVKNGASAQVFSGSNSYSGGTTINAGTLLVENTAGSATGAGSVMVSGGTFGGTGIATASASGASISVAGGATLLAGNGDTIVSAGEKLTLNGTLNLLNNSVIVFTLASGTNTTLALAGATVSFDSNQEVEFILAPGVTGGTFTNLITGLGSDPGVGSWISDTAGHFTYSGGNVGFVMDAVPEPTAWTLLGAGALALVVFRRRRPQAN